MLEIGFLIFDLGLTKSLLKPYISYLHLFYLQLTLFILWRRYHPICLCIIQVYLYGCWLYLFLIILYFSWFQYFLLILLWNSYARLNNQRCLLFRLCGTLISKRMLISWTCSLLAILWWVWYWWTLILLFGWVCW